MTKKKRGLRPHGVVGRVAREGQKLIDLLSGRGKASWLEKTIDRLGCPGRLALVEGKAEKKKKLLEEEEGGEGTPDRKGDSCQEKGDVPISKELGEVSRLDQREQEQKRRQCASFARREGTLFLLVNKKKGRQFFVRRKAVLAVKFGRKEGETFTTQI